MSLTMSAAVAATGTVAAATTGTVASASTTASWRRIAVTTAAAGGGITAASARWRRVAATATVVAAAGSTLAHDGPIQLERRARTAAIVGTSGARGGSIPSARP